ncbi:MAG: septum formation initiator family protein, partial [Spirochaetaceae bacterium]|nr:septum formation initiator family protein [Spirochaetaceae bacterium]
MRKNTILLSISIGTLVYVLISLFCGQNGLWAESQLASQKMDLCNNIAQIQKINDELSLEYTALMQDNEVISAHARRLGFVNDG